MTASVLTRREANIFACFTDAVVAPAPPLPPLAETDAVAFLDDYLGRMPRVNRIGLRALLYTLEVGPLARGFGRRMRRLDPAQRAAYVAALSRGRLAQLMEAVSGIAKLAYYGDDGVMLELGYDPEQVLATGRELRRAEARW